MKKARTSIEADKLEQIPNVGKAVIEDLRILGITRPDQLKECDGIELYDELCKRTGQYHDPCVADTFLAIVDFMNGGKAQPWWNFTNRRKKLLKELS